MSSDLEGDEPELNDIQGEEIVCETYYVLRSDDQDDDTDSTIQSLEGGQRPVRPVERQKMRPWMVELLDNNTLPGLSWQNKKENIFRISWKHAAHNCFNRNRDSDLFERWAFHTGRHHEGNHKRWKANFRCALNSLPDVLELKDLGVRKGDNAFKVYKFLDTPDPTMEEKLRIKQKYSLSNLKAEGLDPLSGSSTPTSSTAPSSPDGQTIADGGIQTLLKAIELKSQQGGSKPSQKRAASGGTTTGRGKRAKKAKEREKVEEDEIEEEEVIETVIHSSSTGEGGINVQNVPLIDSKTGKVTYVQLRTAESVETDTNQLEVSIQSARTSTITSPTVVQTETSQAITITEPKDLVEKNISIPIHLFQQELQKQTNKFPGIINLSTLLAGALPSSSGTVLTGIPAAGGKAGDTGGQTIPFTVLEQIQQARLKELQKMVSMAGAENTLPKTVTEQTASSVSATETVPSLPQAQVNRNITSIAAALRMTPPQTKQSQTPTQVTTATLTPTGVMAQDPQGIRSKLVSRLMVSGSTMTSQAQNLRMQSPTTAPRPRLDQILVKPNPVLNLPKTQLQPVRTTDVITSAVSSSNQEAVLRIVPGSERSLDVKSQLQVEALRDLDPGISSLLSSAEARADILDKQITIELASSTPKPQDESQHYRCLWCQINFERKTDLLHHFLQLHQDMLVVPGEGEGMSSSTQNAPQAETSKASSSAPITVPDVSSTSSDIGGPSEGQGKIDNDDDEDDEPPVIIDVMINTSQGVQIQPSTAHLTSQEQRDDLSDTSTISAGEENEHRPKHSLEYLIKALSESLEQEQDPQLSVMLSPALQQFNIAQATALQTDPGLTGIPTTVLAKAKPTRGRGRGRGRGASSGRGRGGRKRKESDISPEMPRLVAVTNTPICYDDLPESSESDDEGPPKITKMIRKRPSKSETRTQNPVVLPPADEPFIPGTLKPSTSSSMGISGGFQSVANKSEDYESTEDDGSDQAIHVTVKMYEVGGKTIYKCTECGKTFTKTCTFARHAMLHSQMYPYQCGICDMKCGDMRIMLRHLDQHAEDHECACQKCDRMDKDFTLETQQRVSSTFHFKCNLCGKKFFSDYACKQHVNFHRRKLTLNCDQCKLEFRCNRILSRHRKAVHDVEFCPVCLETCTNLIAHMGLHVGFTLFRCGLCGEGYNIRSQLHEHIKTHTQLGVSKPIVSDEQEDKNKIPKVKVVDEEAKQASDTLMALSGLVQAAGPPPLLDMTGGQVSVPKGTEPIKTEAGDVSERGDQPSPVFIVRTGEYEDERGEIDVHVIPKTRRSRFQAKSTEDSDISIELATSPAPRQKVPRRCRWHGNDSLCERCDDTLVKQVASNRKRRGSSTRGRRGSKSPRSDYSDSLKLNSDSLDSLKNLADVSLPLANYILKGDDSKQSSIEGGVIELSD